MSRFGWNEFSMIVAGFTIVMVWVMILIGFIRKGREKQAAVQQELRPGWQPSPASSVGEQSVHLVARLTQRFCPQCRSPLAVDAPEGLCPACLMAYGLASGAAHEGDNGNAVTTPPSGSQPEAAGEWNDLAQHFPQLEVMELLGRGGMGAVYKARQKNLDRMVALKVIPPEAARDPTFAERFAREARALARLNHPNIVTVYDFGQMGELYYLLMEYVDGVNLRHTLRAARLEPAEALAIVPQICDALQYAHDQGVVHRDIKPENVLLNRSGRVKIADFGLAKMLGKGPDNFTLTHTQQVMGTPRYMAPEQIEKPTTVDHRADIYSLGVVLYEMLTGELPIGRFQPPSQKVQLDVRVDQVVLRALEKEPDRRYQRASEVKTELASAGPVWQTPAPAQKHGVGAHSSRDQILRRVRGPAAGLQAAGLLGLVLFALLVLAALYMTRQAGRGFFGVGLVEVLMLLTFIPLSGVVVIGGLQMWQLRTYNLARTAAVLAMLPCNLAWIVSLPMGLWALVVLLDPEVRAAFEGSSVVWPPRDKQRPRRGDSGLSFGAGFDVAAMAIGAIGFLVIGLLVALLVPAIQAAREAARRAQSMNNLKQIGLALHNYHEVYGSLPPAVVTEADGKALYSGRVLLLPFLGQDRLYQSFDLSQAWDSPRNLPVSDTLLDVFQDPSDHSSGRSNYLFVVGQGTMFEEGKHTQFSDVTDGLSQTMMMIEGATIARSWAEPFDADLSVPRALPPGSHSGGNLVLLGDGAVQFLSKTTSPQQFRELATIAGGETAARPNEGGSMLGPIFAPPATPSPAPLPPRHEQKLPPPAVPELPPPAEREP